MKAILQRVKCASVKVDGQLISSINKGMLVLVAVGKNDTSKDAINTAFKVLRLKLWDDELGNRWRLNVQDINGEVLCVSQFTLLASTRKGNKPDFHLSANADQAKQLYQCFFNNLKSQHEPGKVKEGVFQAMMDVNLTNDGPVTIEVNSERQGQNNNDVDT